LRSVSAIKRKGPPCSRSPSTHLDASGPDEQGRAKDVERASATAGQLLDHPQPFEVIKRQRHVFANAPLADKRKELVLILGLQMMA
jgi:hypothetical protein